MEQYSSFGITNAASCDRITTEKPANPERNERSPVQAEIDWKKDVLARITAIEQRLKVPEKSDSTILRTQESFSPVSQYPSLVSPGSHSERAAFLPDEEEAMDMDQASPKAQGGTDLMTPIAMLDRIVGPSEAEQSATTNLFIRRPADGCHFKNCTNFPDCCAGDLLMWTNRTRPQDVDDLRASFKTFFSCLNPHCKLCRPTAK